MPGTPTLDEVPVVSRRIAATPKQQDLVIRSMIGVVERGTAKRIRSDAYRIAGKTGTAQVFTVGQTERYRESAVPERMRDHSLFVAFAPAEDPRIAVAVIVENGGHGGSVAAPIARRVMDAHLLRNLRVAGKGGTQGE